MIRTVRYVVLVAVALILLVVAFANRAPVIVRFLPDDFAGLMGIQWQIEVPAFLLLFLGAVLGIILGFTWEWLREHKHRKVARVQTKAVGKLERELASIKDATAAPRDEVVALLDRPKAR